jgi:hypothetical protein
MLGNSIVNLTINSKGARFNSDRFIYRDKNYYRPKNSRVYTSGDEDRVSSVVRSGESPGDKIGLLQEVFSPEPLAELVSR